MGLSAIGVIACQRWQQIPDHFDHTVLDEFIIMPNHIHGIIGIRSDEYGIKKDRRAVTCYDSNDLETGLKSNVETGHGLSLQDWEINKFSKVLPGSLSVIVNQYKGSVTRLCKKEGYPDFAWQSRFHDHLIRNDKSLFQIREYIYRNPLKWDTDDYYIPRSF